MGMASELEDMASPLMAPARRVRQMMTTVSVTRELPPDQREGMLRHLLRQLDAPGVSGRDDKVNALRSLGVHGGYMSNTLRRPAYTILLGLESPALAALATPALVLEPMYHRDWDQVQLDVMRSFTRIIRGVPSLGPSRATQCKHLERLIHSCLTRHPWLHYYQGFGDICSVFLIMFGADDAAALVERVATDMLRDTLRPNFDKVEAKLALIWPLLQAADPIVCDALARSGIDATVALSWVLTWFSRCFADFDAIARVFDFILATDAVYMPVYLATALIILRRRALLALECEFATVFQFLTQIPPDLSAAQLTELAWSLYGRFPVRRLGDQLDAPSLAVPPSALATSVAPAKPPFPPTRFRIAFADD